MQEALHEPRQSHGQQGPGSASDRDIAGAEESGGELVGRPKRRDPDGPLASGVLRRPRGYINPVSERKRIRWDSRLKDCGINDDGNITISTKRELGWQGETLLEELGHESWKYLYVEAVGDMDLEEVIVKTFAHNMALLWKRNPELFRWLHRAITGETL
jgi:hypothetical protein